MKNKYTINDIKKDKSILPYSYNSIKCKICGKKTELYYIKWFYLFGKPKEEVKCVICSVKTLIKK